MTHTLHRRGDRTDLSCDWVVLAMTAKGISDAAAAPRLRRFLELAGRYGPVNLGDMRQGSLFTIKPIQLLASVGDHSIVHAVFTDLDAVVALLKDLKAADLGVSVVVTGLLDSVAGACQCAGLGEPRKTVQVSLGTWGDTALLPPSEVLEITTMCGHALVSAALVEATAREIRDGELSCEEGARRLAAPCVCGVFNPFRAADVLDRMTVERR